MSEVLSNEEKRQIRNSINELENRGERPLDFDEKYCVYKTNDKPEIESYEAIRQFIASVIDEKQFDNDVEPVIRVNAPNVAVSDSIRSNEASNEPTTSFAVFITYTF